MTEQQASPRTPDTDSGKADDPSLWHLFKAAPRAVRWPCYTLVAVLLVLALVAASGYVVLRRALPEVDGTLEVPGLSASVEVVRDAHGIPHLYGDTDADLARAQGFVHAQERFFEMDLRRHVTSGRLAELFGEDALQTDKFIRTMGWRRVAERELALVSPDTRELLGEYAEGVNAYLDQRGPTRLAEEYAVMGLAGLRYTPEPWTEVDSLAWLKAMAWDLRGNMVEEIDRVMASLDHDPAQVAQLYPPYPYDQHPPIVQGGGVVDGVFEQHASGNSTRNPRRPAYPQEVVDALERVRRDVAAMPDLLGRGDGIGSNSWVVDGEHSATGMPILANDPHLGVSMPGIWMQMGLHCREMTLDCTLDTSGFTFSGVPGVVIGHNADIAWGFTNLGPDVTDLYLEQIEGATWLQDGKAKPLELRQETIKVRDGEDFQLQIRETAHGPLISDVSAEFSTVGANAPTDVPGERGNGYAVALAWTALDPQPTADAILELNRASNWDEFRDAAADFAVPAQNLVYADREGHIGYQAPGRIPIRKSGNDGRMPAEGWVSANDWTGDYIPFDGLPSVLDPDEGFIVTANQAVVGESYPWHITTDWDRGYRATRIRLLLEHEGELSVADMAAIQLDTANPLAPVLVPYLLDIGDLPSAYYRDGQELLAEWDFTQPADSAAAAYFSVVWSNLLRLAFHDDLREGNWPHGGDRWIGVVSAQLEDPASAWWDDKTTHEVVETRDDILRQAMMDARDELTKRRSLDPSDWTWGHLHRLDLRSSTLGESGIALVERLFNRTGYEVGGGPAIVNAMSWDATLGYGVSAAPSMRMVVSLADFDDSRWINLTGVSGHPVSPHYVDQTELFVDGEYLPWAFSREAVTEAGEDVLVLEPAPEE
ncbi:penicillin acylase family protein [Nocardioides gansuensis]|uniref:Penicillin acylase family protein n=1 Tax=Nocardioides gansuensis TaxID=2138300 RepID=A0A2T8F671_9ACTN|nr:penicillin acylase family protein [Nocardioides gansuensis]PVG81210.1 penicillin acylase family protein [Nocardioides gansuensis]